MMKIRTFRKKAVDVQLVQYHAGDLFEGIYVKDGKTYLHNRPHQATFELEDGDFINVTNPNDWYPIKRSVVEDPEKFEDVTPAG